ncbi:PH domain-containing protein [Acidiphilium acidophilum]|uniref:PH domain-containing protein n=2 Tax=Acidiphilium acidophilum TaxID=76588 RepID=A0AAW9DVZ3_ACIAO|nr:PH domain-containing protein [Acidiphilium acidophilum]
MLIAFCVFAFGLISLIIPARYALTVDDSGITLRELTRAQFVPWSEVAGISVVSWRPTTTAGVPSGVRVRRCAYGRSMTDLVIPDIFPIHRDALAGLLHDRVSNSDGPRL